MYLKSKKQEDKYCEMGKFVKNLEFWQFDENRDKRSDSDVLPKQHSTRNTLVINYLSAINCLKKKNITIVIGKIKY
jgi:hypothetical protein